MSMKLTHEIDLQVDVGKLARSLGDALREAADKVDPPQGMTKDMMTSDIKYWSDQARALGELVRDAQELLTDVETSNRCPGTEYWRRAVANWEARRLAAFGMDANTVTNR
jgi:hypothetical protein